MCHLEAVLVPALQPGGPPLEAAHAHRRQEALPPLGLHLGPRDQISPGPVVWMPVDVETHGNTGGSVLPRGEEERPVNERVPLENAHHAVTEDAGNPVHLVGRIA